MADSNPIKYPRRRLSRGILRLVGKALFSLLADVQISGQENYPETGPVILAGNHVAVSEVAVMAVYAPYPVELVGAGDIPLDPNFTFIAKAYDFLPINRGNLDREGLYRALSVLKQGGVLGIFPEGGIWDPGAMQVQTGAAWLSSAGHAPVVPIGFGGMRGAVQDILKLKHPRLTMKIGKPIPPISINLPGKSRKESLSDGSRLILRSIQELVPAEENNVNKAVRTEQYRLMITCLDANSIMKKCPDLANELPHHTELARMLLHPVIMDVYQRNLRLPVQPLTGLPGQRMAEEIAHSAKAILEYLETNRGFLTYRFGIETGLAMQAGLVELYQLAQKASEYGYTLLIAPERRSLPEGETSSAGPE